MKTYSNRVYSLPEDVPDFLAVFNQEDLAAIYRKAKALFQADPELQAVNYSVFPFQLIVNQEDYDVTPPEDDDWERAGFEEWDFAQEGWSFSGLDISRWGTACLEFSHKNSGDEAFGVTLSYGLDKIR